MKTLKVRTCSLSFTDFYYFSILQVLYSDNTENKMQGKLVFDDPHLMLFTKYYLHKN